MRFAFPSSPYIAAVGMFRLDSRFVSFDAEKRSCVIMTHIHNRIRLSEMAGNELFEYASMYKLEWRFDDQKTGFINVYCAPPPPSAQILYTATRLAQRSGRRT